jgi:protein TonB
VLVGANFQFPSARIEREGVPLQVVLVSNQSTSKPGSVDVLAKANLKGSGDRHRASAAKTSVPFSPEPQHMLDAESSGHNAEQGEEQVEQEAQLLMSLPNNDERTYPSDPFAVPTGQSQNSFEAADLVQRSLEIARLEAQAFHDRGAYQKQPKRKFIEARNQEYRFARYVEDWRLKVERIGNLNYPEAAKREKAHGNLRLTVGIKSDGSLESVEINRPSGKKLLDEAAVRIVKLAGQNGFAPFPPDISREVDILHITRTWVFTRSDQLASE